MRKFDYCRGHTAVQPKRTVERLSQYLVARTFVSPTPLLLIGTGGSIRDELELNRIYAEAARELVELWALSKIDHTAALREWPAEYDRRVVRFFDQALLRRRSS